ncbi:PREDICTED: claudin-34 [Nanorana parkeri]|uniref:claudin-34 n=1 Tax=Nanorana parkeri TaxID=125878 RepID=UPI000854774A|nr:PREDICTED: claudin-34 [Nanorana parkeri]
MPYLANTAHLQLGGFAFATVGWILGFVATGLVQWRVWYVTNTTVITSGIAWVGIWRTCFFSHILVSTNQKVMYCKEYSVTDSFVPREIFVAQGLMLTAIILGAMGKAASVFGLKHVYHGTDNFNRILQWFTLSGFLCIFSSIIILIPVAWNMHSVVNNVSIYFPSTYYMPSIPQRQEVGAAICLGIVSAIFYFWSGIFFLAYKLPHLSNNIVHPIGSNDSAFSDDFSMTSREVERSASFASLTSFGSIPLNCDGIRNQAFEWDVGELL